MAITEATRHQMYQRLEELLGKDEAATLMEHLPPVGWADVATRRDLDHAVDLLGSSLRLEFERGLRMQTFALLAANSTLVGLVLAAVKLL